MRRLIPRPVLALVLACFALALLVPTLMRREVGDPLAGYPVPGAAWTAYHDCYYVPVSLDDWYCSDGRGSYVTVSNQRVRTAMLRGVEVMLLELRYAYGEETALVWIEADKVWRATWGDWLTAWVETNHPQGNVLRVWIRARG